MIRNLTVEWAACWCLAARTNTSQFSKLFHKRDIFRIMLPFRRLIMLSRMTFCIENRPKTFTASSARCWGSIIWKKSSLFFVLFGDVFIQALRVPMWQIYSKLKCPLNGCPIKPASNIAVIFTFAHSYSHLTSGPNYIGICLNVHKRWISSACETRFVSGKQQLIWFLWVETSITKFCLRDQISPFNNRPTEANRPLLFSSSSELSLYHQDKRN